MSEKFIQLVRKHEILYNSKCMEYRDQNNRVAAWKDIAERQNRTVEECKTIWAKLRNCHTNALKRRLRKRKGTIPPWRYEGEMAFLLPYMEYRKSNIKSSTSNAVEQNNLVEQSSIIEKNGALQQNSAIQQNNAILKNRDILQVEASLTPDSELPKLIPLPKVTSPANTQAYSTKKNFDKDPYLDQMMGMLKTSQEERLMRNKMDDNDLFFLSMSQSLKKLPNIEQSRLKMDIHKLVYEAELRQLMRLEYVTPDPTPLQEAAGSCRQSSTEEQTIVSLDDNIFVKCEGYTEDDTD